MQNKTFFDANVLIEVLESRKNSNLAISALRSMSSDNFISVLTGHIIMHVCKRVEPSVLRNFLDDYTMLDFVPDDVVWAFENKRNEDFEDALQIAIAIRNGCSTFVTFDKKLAKDYSDLPTIRAVLLK